MVIARLVGRVEAEYVDECCSKVSKATEGAKYLLMDLANLDFISSNGLRGILKIQLELKEKGSEMILVRPNSNVRQIFDAASIGEKFMISSSLESALKLCGEGK